jgi:ribose/xylose/arabinose/galactoside ABC-type transport system permease subunit
LIVLCVIVAIINPRFLVAENLQNMGRLIGAFGIFSLASDLSSSPAVLSCPLAQ